MVLVPPLFDFPSLAARTRILESSYNLLFGKLALRCLLGDYFEDAKHFSTKFLLKLIDDPHVDLIATVFGPLDQNPKEMIIGNALFRWQSDVDDPHTFADLYVCSSDPVFRMKACAYYPKYELGAFVIFPVLQKKRLIHLCQENQKYLQKIIGDWFEIWVIKFISWSHIHAICLYIVKDDFSKSAWLVSKIGRLTVGVQYDPKFEKKEDARYRNLKNWNYAIAYGLGTGSPLSPSFNFGLEFTGNSLFATASFYQHVVVQRRVKNPLEENEVVGITNYIDLGFELQTRVDDQKASNNIQDSTFQVAASWQANKNILLKGKAGLVGSSLCLAFKSWWKPSFTFSMSAIRDRMVGKTSYGFSVCIDNIREARADPNFVMLTPNKEHLAEGIQWKRGSKPLLQSNVDSDNFDGITVELRPLGRML